MENLTTQIMMQENIPSQKSVGEIWFWNIGSLVHIKMLLLFDATTCLVPSILVWNGFIPKV